MVNVNDIVNEINNSTTNQPLINDGTSNYFYARQIETLVQQVMRVFSNYYYETGVNYTGDTQLLPIPCKWGDASRMVSSIIQNNSQNTAITAPIFAVYIKNFEMSPADRKFPVGESVLQVSERAIDPLTGRYTGEVGSQYEVNRLMSIPYIVTFQVDFLFSNASQQWQILEQIGMVFNPAIAIQLNNNPFDWGNLTQMEMTDINYNSKSLPVGDTDPLNIMSFTFKIKPFWLNPPAKVKKLIQIRNVIASVGPDNSDREGIIKWSKDDFIQSVTTVGNNKVSLAGNELVLLGKDGGTLDASGNPYSWVDVLSQMGKYDPETTIIRLRPVISISDASHDVIATFTLDSNNINVATLTFDEHTFPATSIAPIQSFINPNALFPNHGLPLTTGIRYIITKDIIPNTVAWGAFSAPANSIIEFNGTDWVVVSAFDDLPIGTIVKNLNNSKLYVSISTSWVLAIEGIYNQGYFRIEFFSDYANQGIQ